jgi:hypothetical protein
MIKPVFHVSGKVSISEGIKDSHKASGTALEGSVFSRNPSR